MSKRSKSLVGAAWAVLVMVALAFGATQVMASPITACNGPGQIGTCPPLNSASCWTACEDEDYFGGDCVDGCCECLI